MYKAAASCKDIARAPITNREPQSVKLAGYGYAVRHGMKVTARNSVSYVTCNVSVTMRGNVTSVYPP